MTFEPSGLIGTTMGGLPYWERPARALSHDCRN